MPDISLLLSSIYKLTEEIRKCAEERDYPSLQEKLDERGRRLEELRRAISRDITPEQRRKIGDGLREVLEANRQMYARLKMREERIKEEFSRIRRGRQTCP